MRALLVFALFCTYGLFARWYYVCQIKGYCTDDGRLKTLVLKDGDQIVLQGYDQFAFDSAQVAPRLNKNNLRFLDETAKYLKAHPDKNLHITSFYRTSEEDIRSGFYENLGIARADAIRRELIRRGIDENRMTLDYGLSQSESLREPALFEAYHSSRAGEFVRNQFTFHNMTFTRERFQFDSDQFQPNEAFMLYADSVKTYLNLNPGKRVLIIGHTDYIGPDRYNDDLGLRRAMNARQYFRQLGITADIEVRSMGESQPTASNKTTEGRAKNRRVNFIIEDANQ